MIKHWRTSWKLLTSYAKSEEFEWSEITVDELFDRVNSDKPPLLIDVRSPAEFNGSYGHLPEARSVPVLELESHFEEFEPFKDKEIVTMCPGGGMSLVAVEILEKAGFKDVKSLKGGTDLWHKKGYPTTRERTLTTKKSISLPRMRTGIRENDKVLIKTTKVHKKLDARGLSCPMPILKSRIALKELEINQVLEILTTDPGSVDNISNWAHAIGQELIASEKLGPDDYRFLVKRLK